MGSNGTGAGPFASNQAGNCERTTFGSSPDTFASFTYIGFGPALGSHEMHQDNNSGDAASTRREMARAAEAIPGSRDRDITPADGSIARSDDYVSVFCAECQRWIDCYDGIKPEVARERHGTLSH